MCEKRFKKHAKLTHIVLVFSDNNVVTSESKVVLWCYEKNASNCNFSGESLTGWLCLTAHLYGVTDSLTFEMLYSNGSALSLDSKKPLTTAISHACFCKINKQKNKLFTCNVNIKMQMLSVCYEHSSEPQLMLLRSESARYIFGFLINIIII